jgi:predicted transcriptional regulator of viral defense system
LTAVNLVTELASRGRHCFTIDEAVAALGSSVVATRAALRRLKDKGVVAVPYRGFHVIVPPEYRRLGCLPADQFVPELMKHLGLPYYVALLSAARYHGAAHQQPQIFCVMAAKNRPSIVCGAVRVHFVARRNVAEIPVARFNTPRGYVMVSSPEATAFDLVGYHKHAGGLDNVATILAELTDSLDSEGLFEAAKLSPPPWAQRLGYLLELVGAEREAASLAHYVERLATETTPLLPGRTIVGARRDARWKLHVNVDVESEA